MACAEQQRKANYMTNPPGWRHIADDIARLIDSGEYPPGSRLPSLPNLRARYGVSQSTLQKALIVLEDRGMIESRQGVGFFVVGPSIRPVSPPAG